MVRFVLENLEDSLFPFQDSQDESTTIRFLDLGTGNGHLLFLLQEEIVEEQTPGNFHFTGIDYSPDSVDFARKILEANHDDVSKFSFEQVDLLAKGNPYLKNKFDILLDKGTLDAIALNQDPIEEFSGKIGMDVYADQVVQMMKPGSVLILTSCNFTEKELIKVIVGDGSRGLQVWKNIQYPRFEFGGVEGSTICSVAFKLA